VLVVEVVVHHIPQELQLVLLQDLARVLEIIVILITELLLLEKVGPQHLVEIQDALF
jgi:hypothetical protein